MTKKLKSKTIWITGASSGVGEGMARVFHREGADIIISGRREAELERVKSSCADGPGRVMVLPFDIADTAQVEILSGLNDQDQVVIGPYRSLDQLENGRKIAIEEKKTDDEEEASADEE